MYALKVILLTLGIFAVRMNSQQTDPPCLRWNRQNTKCLECNLAKLYYSVSGVCVLYAKPYCTAISKTGKCTQCQVGFQLTSTGDCTAINPIPGCIAYAASGTTFVCVTCDSLTYLAGGVCAPKINNCLTYDTILRVCATCVDNFHTTDDKLGCVANIQHCLTYAPQTDPTVQPICSSCGANFDLSPTAQACWPVIANCQTLGSPIGVCSVCKTDFQITTDLQACLPAITYCAVYQDSTVLTLTHLCQTCKPGFAPSADYLSCVSICTSGSTYCEVQDRCVPIPVCCATNDSCGACTSLVPGFTICPTSQACVPIPAQCPDSHDSCGKCVCTAPALYCPSSNDCVTIDCAAQGKIYDEATCQCQCPSVQTCPCNRQWNSGTCQCAAPPTHQCGQVTWSDSSCDFVFPSCLANQYYSQTSCKCECSSVKTCTCGTAWNSSLCKCSPDMINACGQAFDFEICQFIRPVCTSVQTYSATACGCVCKTPCACGYTQDPATCQCTATFNCLCGATWDPQACSCTPNPGPKCGFDYDLTLCGYDTANACSLASQTYDLTGCSCVDSVCPPNQLLYHDDQTNQDYCHDPIPYCLSYRLNPYPEQPDALPVICFECHAYLVSTLINNIAACSRDSTNYFIKTFSVSGDPTDTNIQPTFKLYWFIIYNGSVAAGISLDSIDFYIFWDPTLPGNGKWTVTYYPNDDCYTIHTDMREFFGNELEPLIYLSNSNSQINIVKGLTTNPAITSGDVPSDDLFFKFTHPRTSGTYTLWVVSDRSGTQFLKHDMTFTANIAEAGLVGFGFEFYR